LKSTGSSDILAAVMREAFVYLLGTVRAPVAALLASGFALAQENTAGLEFFEAKIRPVLAKNCYACHSREAKTAQGGLVVDSRDALLRGGGSGAAVVPGKPEDSLLVKAIRYEEARKMPPMGKLPDAAIADVVKWVEMGAPDPRRDKAAAVPSYINLEKGRQYWAFQPPARMKPPAVRQKAWVKNDVDRFVLSQLEAAGLAPAPDADRRTWIRRVTFDLIGLPPTPEEVESFVNDGSRKAHEKVVDRLLASERFGERWARHWLDVARYAETMGRTRNFPFPFAWRYRDYVIRSFNQDKPYDHFVMEQLAGDQMPATAVEEKNNQLVATGFLALGAHDLNEIDRKQSAMDHVDEMINVTSKAFLGVTVGCARCHDHKFDPIPTRDYYAMAGIFASTEVFNGLRVRPPLNSLNFQVGRMLTLDGVPTGESAETSAQRDKLWKEVGEAIRGLDRPQLNRLARQIGQIGLPANLVMGVRDARQVVDAEVAIRGDVHSPGEKVPRGFLQVTQPAEAKLPEIPRGESGRLQLAQWIANRDNPLTARVMVNRVWHYMFGRGIVDSVDNFGTSGSKPTHQELLDHLARGFMDQGWSVKKVIREIALSRSYQLSTTHVARNFSKDPDNKLFWRMNRRRLEAEAIRDGLLAVSGKLDLKAPAGSPVLKWNVALDANRRGEIQIDDWDRKLPYRTIYLPVVRNNVSRFLDTFDFPEPSETRGRRDVTTVATQALYLMNDPMVRDQARAAAQQSVAADSNDRTRLQKAYVRALARPATAAELDRGLAYLRGAAEQASGDDTTTGDQMVEAWARFYQALFSSAEFRYRN
jgi:hypothetical protein